MAPVFLFKEPSPALRHLIRCHQVIRLHFGSHDTVPAKPYWPRPAISLAFYPRDPEQVIAAGATAASRKPRSAVIGQPTILTTRQGGHDFSVYQIEFQPGALHRLTGLAVNRLTDLYIDAEAIFPRGFRTLVEAITETENPREMIVLAERYLLSIDNAAPQSRFEQIGWASRQLLSGNPVDIAAIANSVGMTSRHLHRLFLDHVGVGPRLFARIARFDKAVRLLNARPEEGVWTAAIDTGYYDHPHIARDFREFTGLSPTQFMAVERAAPERSFGQVER